MKIEIVTSTYNDEHQLSWINSIPSNILITIYNKGNVLQNLDLNKMCINIPNYGRCDYSFLWHIVNNYDKLSDKIIFTKSNWNDHEGCNLNNLLNKCPNFDFCDVGQHAEYTIWIPNIKEKDKYLKNTNYPHLYYTIVSNNPKFKYNYEKYKIFNLSTEIYLKIFHDCPLPQPMILWGHGPCFSVSKDLILRHPKLLYEELLKLFYGQITFEDIKLQQEMLVAIGKNYHDQFQRFWKILFTHAVDKTKFKIEYH